MAETLAVNVQPDQPQPKVAKFQFKKKAEATVAKPPEENVDVAQNAEVPENIQLLELQAIDQVPPDDVLINLLNDLEAQQNQATPQNQIAPVAQALPLQPSNTMNISNVQNVQNVSASHRQMPTMYFGGNSSVVINYNFAPTKDN